MPRCIIIPCHDDENNELKNVGMSKYSLVPISDYTWANRTNFRSVYLPSGYNSFDPIFDLINDKNKFVQFALKLAKTKIRRTSSGGVTNGVLTLDLDFNKAVIDALNGEFSPEFEMFYKMLHSNGISFY